MGCQNKTEIKNTVIQLTESKTTKKEEVRNTMVNNIQRTHQINNGMSISQQTEGPVLVKPNNNTSGTNGSKGFINAITLTLIITFVCGITVGIGYMLYKISVGG